jgi:hypothetical protein
MVAMRAQLALLVVVEGCAVQTSGLAKVATGAAALVKTAEAGEREELERDAERLGKAAAQVKEYCDAVGEMVTFLQANADTPYRKVERDIDARDNKVRKMRTDAKKLLEEIQPIVKKTIPRIAARRAAAPAEERTTPGKFPSRRAIELPNLPGSWRLSGSAITDTAEYTDKAATASVTARQFTAATCEQQKKATLARGDATDVADLTVPKDAGVEWGVRYTRKDAKAAHAIIAMCAPTKSGGILAVADVAPADQAAVAAEIGKLVLRMIAAQLKPTP